MEVRSLILSGGSRSRHYRRCATKRRQVVGSVLALGLLLALMAGLSAAQGPESAGAAAPQGAMGTAFTFQGRLTDGGSPANGAYDLRFKLYDASGSGTQIGGTLTKGDVTVADGLFTVMLDFGSGAFSGQTRYLEVAVRPGSSTGGYTTLSPRQRLTPAPYALFSANSGLLDNLDATAFLRTSGGTVGGDLHVTGDAGIGTTGPQAKLDVVGDVRLSALPSASGVHSWELGIHSVGAKHWFSVKDADDTHEPYRLLIDQDTGDVGVGRKLGIGMPDPQEKLHVDGRARFDLGTGKVEVTTPGGWPGLRTYSQNTHRRDIVFRDEGLFLLTSQDDQPPANDNGIIIRENGNVGIGVWSPATRLEVNGTSRTKVLQITGGSDLAEPFEVAGAGSVQPGMVVAIDPDNAGQLRLAEQAYDRMVAGCVSGANGIQPGLLMQQEGTVADGAFPVALTGRVYCLADAAYGPIQPGDLLTTSGTPGHAMVVEDHTLGQGAILGKAMSALDRGQGLVLVLVALQ